MKKRYIVYFYHLIAIAMTFMIIYGCKKEENNKSLNDSTTALFNPSLNYGTVKDIDGNIYKTITIGTQTWMAENLRTTKFRNGESILKITDNSKWPLLTTEAYCNYNNTNNVINIASYGRIYNWFTICDSRNLAPEGWHIPSESEWAKLIEYLGGYENNIGLKLKEAGVVHWNSPNNGDNSSGFTALPSGFRHCYVGKCFDIEIACYLWTSTECSESNAVAYCLNNENSLLNWTNAPKTSGFSVRCVKD